MKNNWPTKKLGEVAEAFSGTWGSPDSSGTAVLRSTNFNNNGTILWNDVAYRSVPSNKVDQLALNQGDILLEKSGGSPAQPVGRVVYFEQSKNEKIVYGNFISKLQVKNKDMEPKFLFYYLLYFYKTGNINKYQSQTTGIRNLHLKDYLGIEIPKFDTNIQKKIVERLNAIRKAQELCDTQIQKNEEFFESLFISSIVNGIDKKLGELFDRQCKTILPIKTPNKEFNFIGLENIESNTGNLINFQVNNGGKIKSNKFIFQKGDVLYGKLRPYLNKVWLAGFNGICSTDIWVLRPNSKKIDATILSTLVKSNVVLQRMSSIMTGTNLPRANPKSFDSLIVKIPTLKNQKELTKKLDATQDYKKLLLKQKSLLKELFDSVLYKSMNGEMDN